MEILFFLVGVGVGFVAFNKTKLAKAYRDLRLKYEIRQEVFKETHERFKLLNKKTIPRAKSEINFKAKALILEKDAREKARALLKLKATPEVSQIRDISRGLK